MANLLRKYELVLPETRAMREKNICITICLIPLTAFFRPKNPRIQAIIDKLSGSTNIKIQVECMQAFAAYLNEPITTCDQKFVLKLVAFLYIGITPKHPIKKHIFRLLLLVRDVKLLAKKLSESIKTQLSFAKSETDPAKVVVYTDHFIYAMNSSLELPAVVKALTDHINLVFEFTFDFMSEVVDCIWERKLPSATAILIQQKTYIYNASKFFLSLVQRGKAERMRPVDRCRLITCCYDIITHKHVQYDTKSNCAHIMVLLFTRLPEDIRGDCTFKDHPYLEFLKFGKQSSPVFEALGLKDIEDSTTYDTFKVCVYVGILIVAPSDILRDLRINNKPILLTMFHDLIDSAKMAKRNSAGISMIAEALNLLVKKLSFLSVEEVAPLVAMGLEYAVIYLEDRNEIVKSNTKSVFENLIKLAMNHTEQGNDSLQNMILHWLRNLPDCGIRYMAITLACTQIGCRFLLREIPHLARQLLFEMKHPAQFTAVYSCYETLMKAHLKEVEFVEEWVEYWVDEIVIALRKSEEPCYQRLFISAFGEQPIALKALTKERYLNTHQELVALIGCLHSAYKNGVVLDVDSLYIHQIDQENSWRRLLEYRTLEILQTHQNDAVRVLVVALIVDTQRSTELYTEWEMQFLPNFLLYNINTCKTSKRQQIIACFKKGMCRANSSIVAERRRMDALNTAPVPPPQTEVEKHNKIKKYYKQFWKKLFTDVMLPGLLPDSNYSRRSACLDLLIYAYDQLNAREYTEMFDHRDFNNLKHILQYDTFERNKDLATKLLTLFTPEQLGFGTTNLLQNHIDKCFSLAINIKPTQTISAAYMLKTSMRAGDIKSVLLERLNSIANLEALYKVSINKDPLYLLLINLILELHHCYTVGEQNLQEAAATKPIHGFVFSIRHLLRTEKRSKKISFSCWRQIFSDIINSCFKLNTLVKPIICNPSPEGYLPDDSDGDITQTDETTKAQMLTVYGWRAAKEISLLLGEMVYTLPFYTEELYEGLIDEQQIRDIGEYFFNLLVNTKHRGAFEQASVGFTSVCSRLWRLPVANLNKLPSEWLKKIFDILLGVGEETVETCATRRSAGMPFMVQAILTTEPDNGNEEFNSCMKTLIIIADDVSKPEEQRIHCLNILRALYRHNQLNELVLPYCSHGMMIAIKGFGSNIWGIRNSATLLFSSLLIRIFGVPRSRDAEVINIKNKMIAQVFFVRYPELYVFLLAELKKAAHDHDYPTLFPVLLILSRLYRIKESADTFQLEAYLKLIQSCLSNPVYRIRDLAARTSVCLMQPSDVKKYIVSCCLSLSDVTISNTYCHGVLLQLQYLLQIPHQKYTLNVARILDSTSWILACCNKHISHLTATLYLEIITALIRRFDPGFKNCAIFQKVSIILQWQATRGDITFIVSPAMRKYTIHMFNLKIYMFLHIMLLHSYFMNVHSIEGFQTMIQEDINKHSDLRNMCISYTNYLKFSQKEYAEHNLFEQDNYSEYTPLINTHLKSLRFIFKEFLYKVFFGALAKITIIKENFNAYMFGNTETTSLQLFSIQCFSEHTIEKNSFLLSFGTFCESAEDHVICTMIAFVDTFLQNITDEEIPKLDFTSFFYTVVKFCVPTIDAACRLAMCRLLVSNKRLFYQKGNLLPWHVLSFIWEAVFLLLEDDNEVVHNTICQLCEEDLQVAENEYIFIPEKRVDIPEYARAKLFKTMGETVPYECVLNLLLYLIFRRKKVGTDNISEIFDEGEQNTYAEEYPMAKDAIETCRVMLWTLRDGLNFEKKSIFIEEQTLIIATVIYDKCLQRLPFINARLNTALKNVLTRVILFVEKVVIDQPDFKTNFKRILEDALVSSAVEALEISESTRLKLFFRKMYEILL